MSHKAFEILVCMDYIMIGKDVLMENAGMS